MILSVGIDIGRRPPFPVQHVPLVGTLEHALDETVREWESALIRGNAKRPPPPAYREAAARFLPPALSLILYLCSRSVEIAGAAGGPANPTPQKTRRGMRIFPANGPRQWEVGVRLGAALRTAYARESEGGNGHSVYNLRPHIRGAHWHTYLLGPRAPRENAAPQRRELRWLPPIPVAIEDYDALPTVIRPVRP